MEIDPFSLTTESVLEEGTKQTKALSREQARKFAQLLARRGANGLDLCVQDMPMDCSAEDALHQADEDVWNYIAKSRTDGTILMLMPNGNVSNGETIDPHHPALAVFVPHFTQEYIHAQAADDDKTEHQSIFDNYSVA